MYESRRLAVGASLAGRRFDVGGKVTTPVRRKEKATGPRGKTGYQLLGLAVAGEDVMGCTAGLRVGWKRPDSCERGYGHSTLERLVRLGLRHSSWVKGARGWLGAGSCTRRESNLNRWCRVVAYL